MAWGWRGWWRWRKRIGPPSIVINTYESPPAPEAPVSPPQTSVANIAPLAPVVFPDPRWYEPERIYHTWNPTRPAPPSHGWISPAEQGGEASPDTVIQFRFDRDQWMNRIQFELSDDPVTWSLWFFDLERDLLVQMSDRDGTLLGGMLVGGRSVTTSVEESFEMLHSPTQVSSGNFIPFDFKLPKLKTPLVEIHLNRRVPEELLPVHLRTQIRLAYPIAVRNVKMLHEITKREELPPLFTEDVRIITPTGNIERLTLKEWDAARAIDGQDNSYWQCEPQPIPTAVVSLYLDVHDASGAPQLIDRIELDPVYTGPTMNIYWSNDDAATAIPRNEGTSSQQHLTVNATGGTYTLFLEGKSTAALAYNASATDIQTAIEALDNVPAGSVTVTQRTPGTFLIDFDYVAGTLVPVVDLLVGTATVNRVDYDLKEWTPIARDFILTRGIFHLLPTRCKYLKLEFTNLIPQPYPVWDEGIERRVKEYPQWVHQWYAAMSAASSAIPYTPKTETQYYETTVQTGTATNVSLVPTGRVWVPRDQPVSVGGNIIADDWMTTRAYVYTTSPTYGRATGRRLSIDDEVEFRTELEHHAVKKKFFRTVRHEYDERVVKMDYHTAFFVGLREVRVFRSDMTVAEDTPEYIETFGDNTLIDTTIDPINQWTTDPNYGYKKAWSAGNILQTKVLNSFSNFRAVQLAVSASDWESQMSDAQMSLVTYTHLNDLSNTRREIATDRFSGEGAGNVLLYSPLPVAAPTFSRASVAYKRDGSAVASGTPRYETGKYGSGIFIEEGTTNLLTVNQSSVETDATGFTAYNSTIVRSLDRAKQGAASLLCTAQATATAHYGTEIAFTFAPSTTYTVTAWVYPTYAGTADFYASVGGTTPNMNDVPKALVANIWNLVTWTFTTPADAGAGTLYPRLQWADGVTFYLDQIQVEQKAYATSWQIGGTARSAEALTAPISVVNPQEGTFEAWVEVNAQTRRSGVEVGVFEATRTSGSSYGFLLYHSGTNWSFVVWNGTTVRSIAAPDSHTPDGWHHFAVRWSVSEIALFIDGVRRNYSTTLPIPLPSSLAGPVHLGKRAGAGQINALLDDVRISDRARTDQEIADAYNSGAPAVADKDTTYMLHFENELASGIGYGTRTTRGIYSAGAAVTIPWDDAGAWDEPLSWDAEQQSETQYDASAAYDTTSSYDGGAPLLITEKARTSGVVRFLLPQSANGKYELRLYERGRLVERKPFVPPAQKWHEEELYYLTKKGETDFQVEIVQTNPAVTEPFALDFLGIFQNPVRWEISNDSGTSWKVVNQGINDPHAFITLPNQGNQLVLRATALRRGAVVSSFTVVPWYLESPLVKRVPIDYVPPWGESDREDLRATVHKPQFRSWARLFPQRYSLDQLGNVPTSGTGFRP